MRFRYSLRYRVAVAFALFGALISVLLAVWLFVATYDFERHLLAETLNAELEDYMARHALDPQASPPASAAMRAYVTEVAGTQGLPAALQRLEPGFHQVRLDGVVFYAEVRDREDTRFYLLYDETQLKQREQQLLTFLAAGVLVMAAVSAGAGLWLARRVITPVTELARRLAQLRPQDRTAPMAEDFPRDEVGELAHIFDRYMERLQAFIEREQAFTADLSHELRTPLAVINGAAEILLEEPGLPETARRPVERVIRAVQEMSQLSSTLLALAREEGRDPDPPQLPSVAEVLENVVDSHRYLVAHKPVAVALEIVGEPKLPVAPAVVRIALGNLVRNAFSYTDRGRVRLRLTAHELTIEDTGQGIAPEALARIFQRHYRDRDSRGIGIGLALVKRICERQGWRIRVDSLAGQCTLTVLSFEQRPPLPIALRFRARS